MLYCYYSFYFYVMYVLDPTVILQFFKCVTDIFCLQAYKDLIVVGIIK